jgi:hypothetical protein
VPDASIADVLSSSGKNSVIGQLALHALVLAAAFGLVFKAAEFSGQPALYRLLGGDAAALGYADVVFSGAILVWIVSLLAAALRGAFYPSPRCSSLVGGRFRGLALRAPGLAW